MILSDRDIRKRLEVGDILIEPMDDPHLQIQPASVDLRLGREFLTFDRSNIQCIHPEKGYEAERYVSETTLPGSSRDGQQTLSEYDHDPVEDGETVQEEFVLHPGDFVLGTTKETVGIPDDLIAHVEGRSSLGRLAIVVHASLPADEELFLWTPREGFGFYEIGDIAEHERRAFAVSFDPKTLRVGTHRVTDYIKNPTKRIYRVTLQSGRQVHVTADHNLFTLDEYGGVTRIASEEAEGSRVMVPGTLPASGSEKDALDLVEMFRDEEDVIAYATDGFGAVEWERHAPQTRSHYESRNAAPMADLYPAAFSAVTEVAFKQSDMRIPRELALTEAFGWILGFYIAEGSARRTQLQFANKDREYLRRIEEWFEHFDVGTYWSKNEHEVHRLTICSAMWSELFTELAGSGSEKNIPDDAWNWPASVLEAMLDGLLDGDGHRREARDTLYTANASLANRTMYLATRLGYYSSVYSREREQYIEKSDVHRQGMAYAVDIATDPHKRGQFVPNPNALLRELRSEAGYTLAEVAERTGHAGKTSISNVERRDYEGVMRDTLRRLNRVYREAGADTTRLEQILQEDVRFERVVSVEETDRVEPTYDLEVQPEGQTIENFLGGRGGIFLSNTAGLCDPGFQGKITLELSNLGTAPVALTPDMRIAQLTFTELTSPAERPYGEERGSKYQGQTGPAASRIEDDHEFGGDQKSR